MLGVLKKGSFILGQNVQAFEDEMAAYIGVEHAIGVASGTDALTLTLRAMGVGPGDEVIVPAFTFFASAGAALLLGAKPVLVDVDPATYCLDVAQLEEKITPKTKAIMPVHLFGHSADMDPILEIAGRYGIRTVEDNAQAVGATYKGRKTGGIGDAGCLSFYPTKNLGAYGDAGMILTNDASLARSIRMLRTHGWDEQKYFPEFVGYNSRLDEVQAAILRVKLPYLDLWNQKRRTLAAQFGELLVTADAQLPRQMDYASSVYHLYVVRVQNRDKVTKILKSRGVSSAVYYPYPLHVVPAMQALGYNPGDYPVSEDASNHLLAIPLFPEMSREQVEYVANALSQADSPILEEPTG